MTWAAYALLAMVLFFPLVVRFSSHILADDVFIEPGRSDAYNFLWTYWWIQKAALAGQNFYQCDWVMPPTGANLYFHTHVVLPTLLTIPFGLLLGPVGGYNSMILLMLSGAACVYYTFLRCTFQLPVAASFIAGAMFGFSPYFVFKAHAHVNLIGAAFWGGCLSVLAHAYLRDCFGWRQGLLFALSLWATFWTSFVEFFALVIVCGAAVTGFEIARRSRAGSSRWPQRAAFFSMALAGVVSLGLLSNAPNSGVVDVQPFGNVQLADLLMPPRLSYFGGIFEASEFEYWGSHIPIVFVLLAAIGIRVARKQIARCDLIAVGSLVVLLAVLTLNPYGVPINLIRRLPMGTGFRVAGRFLPFIYFFLLIPAALGINALLGWRAGSKRTLALGALAALAAVELFPAKLSPSAVKSFEVPNSVAVAGARGAYTMIIPRAEYTNLLDTYQVSMNVPVLHLSYLAREDPRSAAMRAARFPALYPNPKQLSADVLDQMRAAGAHYVLFEDRRQYDNGKFPGEVVVERNGAVLVRY